MRVAALVCFMAAAVTSLEAQGFEAQTRHFRVITDGIPETACSAAVALERLRSQLVAMGFPAPRRLTEVVLFVDPEEMRRYGPGRGVGFFQRGAEAAFIGVTWTAGGDPLKALAHEFAHEELLALTDKHPLWLREGLAELFSNVVPGPAGLKLGAPVPSRVQALKRRPWLAWNQVLSAGADSELFQDLNASAMFYAQSWVLAHALVVGKDPADLLRRIETLQAPTSLVDLKLPETLPSETIPAAAISEPDPPSFRPLEAWERPHRLAELLRVMRRSSEAREALLALRSHYPDQPALAESLGALEFDEFNYARAEHWLAEAVRLGSSNAASHYRYSLLLMHPGKRAQDAAQHARRAVELDSSQPLHWLAKAHTEMQLSQWQAARASLGQVRQRAEDAVLVEQVRIELDEIERRREQALRPPPRPKSPVWMPQPRAAEPEQAAPAPASVAAAPPRARSWQWPPPGTLTLWGYIRRVECGTGEKIVTVSNARLAVRVREPVGRPARLFSPPGNIRRIPCSLKNVEVNVVYRPSAKLGAGLNGDLVAVLF